MGLRRLCADVRFLGSYPRCDGGQTQMPRGTSDAEFAAAAGMAGPSPVGRPLTGRAHRRPCEPPAGGGQTPPYR